MKLKKKFPLLVLPYAPPESEKLKIKKVLKLIYQETCLKNEHSHQKDYAINLTVKHKQRRNTNQNDVIY